MIDANSADPNQDPINNAAIESIFSLGATRPQETHRPAWIANLAQSGVKRRDCPRRLQRSFGDGLIAAEIKDLHEVWMPHADIILADDEIVHAVHQALVKRHPKSLRRGRPGFPAAGGAALADPEARAKLELPGPGTRGPRQLGLSRLHSYRQ